VIAVILAFTLGPLAWATERERIVVERGPAIEREYPGLPAPNDPLLNDTVMPENCKTLPGCDTIPLTIVPPPGLTSNQDYFVEIVLSWDPTTNSDLQLYVWDDPPETDPPTPQRVIAQSSTSKNPERVLLYRPNEKSYFIVVHNPAGTAPGNVPDPGGPNTGYALRLEMTFRSYDSPFELLEPPPPDFAPPATSAPGAEVAPPSRPRTTPTSPYTTVPLRPDASFGELIDRPSALDSLQPPGGIVAAPTFSRPRAGPVNGFLLALWAGVVPAAVVGGGALFLRRRAAATLDLD
jgi:hypothetical protein